jgi:hypothetical protein
MFAREIKVGSGGWGLISFGVFILPTLAAIWFVPWFVTGDGPSHLYNAYIMGELIKGNSFLREVYALHWQPVPNLVGHWLLVALMQVVPARTADRLLMTLTSVGLASAVLWLRWRVAGRQGIALIAPLAVFLTLTWIWLWGFYNFLLGACLFPITLGYWWVNRDTMRPKRAVILAGLLVLGYFCHLLSLLLTAFGLVILAVMTPGPRWLARCRWTAVSLMPLLPLGFLYHRLSQAAGAIQPQWRAIPRHFWSLLGWLTYLEREDPFAILPTNPLPLLAWANWWFHFLYPPLWLAVGVSALMLGTFLASRQQASPPLRTYRGWIVLAFCLVIAWAVAPSRLGEAHGGVIPIRLLPLALIAIVPILIVDSRHIWGWIGAGALAVAVTVQSAVIWEVALTSNGFASTFIEAIPSVGTGRRIRKLFINMPSAFPPGRRNILHRHLDSLLGIGTNNLIWNNYEAVQYYFPVQFRHPIDRDIAQQQYYFPVRFRHPIDRDIAQQTFGNLELIRSKPPNIEHLIDRWARSLADHHDKIDVLVVWGTDPRFDQIIRQWYGPEPVFQRDELRVFYHH